MKRLVIACIAVFVCYGVSIAQEANNNATNGKKYTFRYLVDPKTLSSIDQSMLSSHPFGDLIARKLYVLQDLYTYTEAATPTSPAEKTIVLKPTIYNAIMKLNRNYKKMVKNGMITSDVATQELDYCLDVAISVAASDTDSLEADMRKAPDLNEITKILMGVELIK